MPRRLIAFGCSFTYGHGLPDCHLPGGRPGPHPSKHAWPAVVAKNLGRECVNKSAPGSSPKQVARAIMETEFHKDDVVAIWWPHVSRTAYFTEDNIFQLGPWPMSKVDATGIYKKLLNHWHYKLAHLGEHDGHVERIMWITFVNSYLEARTRLVTNYIHDRDDAVEKAVSCVPYPVALTDDIIKLDFALDNDHPGLKSHKAIAGLVLRETTDRLRKTALERNLNERP